MVFWVEGVSVGRLGTLPRPAPEPELAAHLKALRSAGVDLLVSALTPDENRAGLLKQPKLARKAGIELRSFPILDRGVPGDEAAARVLCAELAERVRQGAGVAVHCWGGIGRSTLLAAGTLVALGWSAPEALAAIGRARGLPVPDTPLQREWILRLSPDGPEAPGEPGAP